VVAATLPHHRQRGHVQRPALAEPTRDDFLLGLVPAVGVSSVERVDFDLEDARTEFRIRASISRSDRRATGLASVRKADRPDFG